MTMTLHCFALAAMLGGTALAAGALGPLGVAPARAQGADSTQAGSPLPQAQALYDQAKFADAAALLRTAIARKQLAGNDELKARELLGRSLVKSGNRLAAKEAFKALLHEDSAYRLDTLTVPPDELEVFNLAVKEIDAEQTAAGQRIPASLGFFYGTGSGDNKSYGEVSKAGGGPSKLDNKPEFGGTVRFPILPKFSLDIEMSRFRATATDKSPFEYTLTGSPLVASLYYTAFSTTKIHLNGFVGVGSLLDANTNIKLPLFGVPINLSTQKNGWYYHAGVEGEYLVLRKLSVNGRVLLREATAKDMNLAVEDPFNLYSNTNVNHRKIDFSGFGAFIGLRAYIGS
ncbi:MAG TPA: tetratricopeptide repeat protein [Candidatus Eisenbacteria bacterium]|nr:tetratricopeptide repeat protein [Candidatus Eisenbacteria bacterium]